MSMCLCVSYKFLIFVWNLSFCFFLLFNYHDIMPKKTACQLYHEEKVAGPCTVCKESKPRYWHIAQATPANSQLVIVLRQKNILDYDCVCYACKLRLSSVKDESRPPSKRPSSNTCQLPNCTSQENVHQTSKFVNRSTLINLFDIDDATAIELCCNRSGIFLCHAHYCILTNKIIFKDCSICLSTSSVDDIGI